MTDNAIIYTHTDEAPLMATYSFLPIIQAYAGVLQTEDTTPLEPKLVEHKYYARGVGVVAEETVAGGHEQVRLVAIRRP